MTTPLKESIMIDDVGVTAIWLIPDIASRTIDEVLFVDSGYNILELTFPERLEN